MGRILRDIRYTGTMVSGKRTQIAPLVRKTKAVPRDEWIVVPDTHEGIISAEVYEAAQKLLPETGVRTYKVENLTLFGGKLFCGHCGFTLRRNRAVRPYYICYSKNYVPSERCLPDHIYEDSIKDAVLSAFKKNAELAMAAKDEMRAINSQNNASQSGISNQLLKLSGKERQFSERKARLFEDFAGGKISKEQYLDSRSMLADELEKIAQKKVGLESKAQSFEPVSETNYVIGLLERLSNIQEVTPELAAFVKRINVFDSERIEIEFTFADELNRLFSLTDMAIN